VLGPDDGHLFFTCFFRTRPSSAAVDGAVIRPAFSLHLQVHAAGITIDLMRRAGRLLIGQMRYEPAEQPSQRRWPARNDAAI